MTLPTRMVCTLMFLVAITGCQAFQKPMRKVAEPWPTRPSPEFCDLGAGAESFASLQAMPKSIVDDVLSNLGKPSEDLPDLIVERDQAFFETDIIFAGRATSFRRFVQGGNLGNRWMIWFEEGGLGYSQSIWGYELNQTTDKPVLLGRVPGRNYRDRPCTEIVDFLNHRGPKPGPILPIVGQDR